MKGFSFALALVLLWFGSMKIHADSKYAVLRMPSHGGSGTVIATGKGWSLILSCAHCFQGNDARKPIALDVPVPWEKKPGEKVGVKLLGVNHQDDLSLLMLNYGPLPYVCPVAPVGHRPGRCLSVGFDEMAIPPQMRDADIVGALGNSTMTKQRPWHGRSGGALICKSSGYLVGVCSAYTGPKNKLEIHPGGNGVYVSHSSILRFISQHGYGGILEGKGLVDQESQPPFSAPFESPPPFTSPRPGRPPQIFEQRKIAPCPGGV